MSFTDLSPLSSPRARIDASSPPARHPEAGRAVRRAPVRPPRGFKLICGAVSNVRFGGEVPHNRGYTHAQREGLRYEQRVHDVLLAIYGSNYRPSAAILFEDRTGLRRAIPDGLLRVEASLVVVEIKLSHTERAWWQLNRLYAPLLAQLTNPGTAIHTVEICRSYDPEVRFPGPFSLTKSLHKLQPNVTGIIQWKI